LIDPDARGSANIPNGMKPLRPLVTPQVETAAKRAEPHGEQERQGTRFGVEQCWVIYPHSGSLVREPRKSRFS